MFLLIFPVFMTRFPWECFKQIITWDIAGLFCLFLFSSLSVCKYCSPPASWQCFSPVLSSESACGLPGGGCQYNTEHVQEARVSGLSNPSAVSRINHS